MADAYSVLRPGAWWRKTGAVLEIHFAIEELLVPGEAFDAARTMILEHLSQRDPVTLATRVEQVTVTTHIGGAS